MAAKYDQYKDRGFIIIHLWPENDFGSVPTAAELMQFSTQYGTQGYPNVADPGWSFFNATLNSNFTPAHMLIAPGLQIVSNSMPSDAEIEAVLPPPP